MADGIEDIRIAVGLADHFKTKRLIRAAGEEAFRCLVRLWCWAAVYRHKGDLDGLTDEEIEDAAGWTGDAGRMLDALRSAGFLEGTKLHGWSEHQPYIYNKDKRRRLAKKAANARWAKRYGDDDAERMPDACGTHAERNAPPPTPTPTPTPTPVGGGGEGEDGRPPDPTGSAVRPRPMTADSVNRLRACGCTDLEIERYVAPLHPKHVEAILTDLEEVAANGGPGMSMSQWLFRRAAKERTDV